MDISTARKEKVADKAILITPPGGKVAADRNNIYFPPIENWVEVPAKTARFKVGTPEAPWPTDMAERISQWNKGDGGKIDFTNGKQLRLGVQAGLMVHWKGYFVPVFYWFDSTHPSRAQRLTTFGGLLSSRNIMKALLDELGEEAIFTLLKWDEAQQKIIGRKVGAWSYEGAPLNTDWVKEYAQKHDFEFDPALVVPVTPLEINQPKVNFHFGDQIITGWPAFEPDTGSIELIKLFEVTLPDDAVIANGEKLPNGEYQENPPVPMFLTDKAFKMMEIILRAQCANWTGAPDRKQLGQ